MSADQQQPIVDIVEQILALKRNNSDPDILSLETQLDTAVETLYNLPKEIANVKGIAK